MVADSLAVLCAAWCTGFASSGAGERSRPVRTSLAMEAFKRISVAGGAEGQSIFYVIVSLEVG